MLPLGDGKPPYGWSEEIVQKQKAGNRSKNGWQQAAYFRNLTFFWQPATYWWWDSGSVNATDSACYSANGPFYSSDPSWRNWFFYGGPGKEASGCL